MCRSKHTNCHGPWAVGVMRTPIITTTNKPGRWKASSLRSREKQREGRG